MSGPTLIARLVPRISKKLLGKDKSKARLSMTRLLDQWEEIIAPEDPMAVRPVRVGWKWKIDKDVKTSEGTLYITAPSAMAVSLSYQQAIIVGRINRLFGLPENGCVTRMSIVHDASAALPPRKAHKNQKAGITTDTQATLDGIDDPVLREKLAGLAKAMAVDGVK